MKKEIGKLGEKIAKKYLQNKGYEVLETNFQNKWGEIDLIGKKEKKIIFFEVKTILKKEGFFPEDKITSQKKKQLLKMAQIFLSANKIPFEKSWQVDVLSIEIERNFQKAKITHYKNILEDHL